MMRSAAHFVAKTFLIFVLGLVILSYSRILFGDYLHFRGDSDFRAHLRVVVHAMTMLREGELSHPGMHLVIHGLNALVPTRMAQTMMWTLAVCKLISFWVSIEIFRRLLTPRRLGYAPIFAAACFSVVSALFLPWVDGATTYSNKGSPNIWHNPTNIFVHPLVLALPLVLASAITRRDKRLFLLGGFLLAIGVSIKPNIALFTLPALFLVMAWEGRTRLVAAALEYALVAVLPVVLLLYLYFLTYSGGDESTSRIAIGFFRVWKLRGVSPLGNFVLANALPLVALAIHVWRREDTSTLEWLWGVMFAVAYAQAAFFYETGAREAHGNFNWGYNMTLSYSFLFGITQVFRYAQQRRHALLAVPALLLLWHAASGVRFMVGLVRGGWYATL